MSIYLERYSVHICIFYLCKLDLHACPPLPFSRPETEIVKIGSEPALSVYKGRLYIDLQLPTPHLDRSIGMGQLFDERHTTARKTEEMYTKKQLTV